MKKHGQIDERKEIDAARQRLQALDEELAPAGAYLSYPTPHDPALEEFNGPDPAKAIDEILASYATPESRVLDWGCGAGFTLCRLARTAREVWGFDEDGRCIEAAGLRARCEGLGNVRLIHGGAGDDQAVGQGRPTASG